MEMSGKVSRKKLSSCYLAERRTFLQLLLQTLSYNASSKTSYFFTLLLSKNIIVSSKERWSDGIHLDASYARSNEFNKFDKFDHQSYEMCEESPLLSPLQLARMEVDFFTFHIKNEPVRSRS